MFCFFGLYPVMFIFTSCSYSYEWLFLKLCELSEFRRRCRNDHAEEISGRLGLILNLESALLFYICFMWHWERIKLCRVFIRLLVCVVLFFLTAAPTSSPLVYFALMGRIIWKYQIIMWLISSLWEMGAWEFVQIRLAHTYKDQATLFMKSVHC